MNHYFVRNNHKTYTVLVHTKPFYRYLATAVICGGIFFSWYRYVFSINGATHIKLEQEIAQLKDQHIMHARSKDSHATLNTSIDVLRDSYRTYTAPCKQAAAPAVATLLNVAKRSHVLLNACDCSHEQECGWYTTESLSFDVSGELNHLMQFLASLSQAKVVLDTEHIRISALQEKNFNLACSAKLITVKN